MNIQQLRYVLEMDKTRSITEAAENLYMNQPNLSRALKELEGSLGFQIFERSGKGLATTKRGEEFVQYARGAVRQFDELEKRYSGGGASGERYRLAVPRASYIAEAFADIAKSAENGLELDYMETNALSAIRAVADDGYDLGIVRYQASFEDYFIKTMREKGLDYRELWSFRYLVLTSREHKKADKPVFSAEDIAGGIQIRYGDSYNPAFRQPEDSERHSRVITVYERGSRFQLLSQIKNAYMWVSPVPKRQLERYQLCQHGYDGDAPKQKDVLIYRKGTMLSPMDDAFLTALQKQQDALVGYAD
ncbi:MAG: LysR family transcriptional regulator [Eubacteriales bacterium]|nr:LysR family transcriptional regulator [Eubacteriales bacterium]MDD3881011.1 LysR family transcriptional regulator [Eubacteriales bacterium]MDD4511920.1 LysR family transcriptional regulator [Eubacteriales bacterium]